MFSVFFGAWNVITHFVHVPPKEIGILADHPAASRHACGRVGNAEGGDVQQRAVSEFLSPTDRRIRENASLDAITLQCGNNRFDTADLHDGDVFFRHQSEMTQRDPGAGVDGSSESANS